MMGSHYIGIPWQNPCVVRTYHVNSSQSPASVVKILEQAFTPTGAAAFFSEVSVFFSPR